MRILTIQHRKVLEEIQANGIYKADMCRIAPNHVKPYGLMMKTYGYETCPIFGAIIGYRVNFYGAHLHEGDTIVLELEVPREFVHVQDYYDWSDVIFYMEEGEDPYAEKVLTRFDNEELDNRRPLQATLPYILKEWVVTAINDEQWINELIENHYGVDRGAFLKEISYYQK